MRRFVFIILLLPIINFIYGQNGFKKYNLYEVGSIKVSTKMKLKSKAEYIKSFKAKNSEWNNPYIYPDPEHRVIFMQKNKNDYARIIIKTDFTEADELNQWRTPTRDELNEFNLYQKEGIKNSMRRTPMKMIRWLGTNIVYVNKQKAIKISYERQLRNQPIVLVNMYVIPNKTKKHYITLSYRKKDRKVWQPLFQKTLSSFKVHKEQ